MKYLEKSFTLPASPVVTQEAWDKIWGVTTDEKVLSSLAHNGLKLDLEKIKADYVDAVMYESIAPPATESENPIADTVAIGGQCPNCHCGITSYRHIETCVTPGESDCSDRSQPR